jgi:hypothetical protein
MAFPPHLKAALATVLADCKGANTHMTVVTPGHPGDVQDVLTVQSAMQSIGITLTYGESHNLWDLVSLDRQENWATCSANPNVVLIDIEVLCQHVTDGCDYAGMSGPAA